MQGKIESGQLCTVEPVDTADLNVGDIVLCKVNGKQYLHLVKAIQGKRFQIGNNRGRINGWVGENSIYGKCTRIEWRSREDHTSMSGMVVAGNRSISLLLGLPCLVLHLLHLLSQVRQLGGRFSRRSFSASCHCLSSRNQDRSKRTPSLAVLNSGRSRSSSP